MRLNLLLLGVCSMSLAVYLSCASQIEPATQREQHQVPVTSPVPITQLPISPLTTNQHDPQPKEEATPSTSGDTQSNAPFKPQASVGACTFLLELATTAAQHERGLMERAHLSQGHGMLFVYPEESIRHFWMFNTFIPLDIFFIDSESHVVAMHTMLPEPGVGAANLTIYSSIKPAQYALEVNAGMHEECGVSLGTPVKLILEP